MSCHLLESNPLFNHQWGFQAGKGTVAALLTVTNEWLNTLDSGGEICAVFFDLKVFDSVPYIPLIERLVVCGLCAYLVRWITSYLTNRKQRVVVEGVESGVTDVLSGMPQGSVLGPLLFLIYIDDVSKLQFYSQLRPKSIIILYYADDMLLYKRVDSFSDFIDVQEDIDHVDAWVTSNKLCLNFYKCKFMLVSRKKRGISPQILLLNGSPLEQVFSYKYLGIYLASDMRWRTNIDHICTVARKLIGLLYRQFYNIVDSTSLLELYRSMIRLHLEYAAAVWDPHLARDKDQLEKVCFENVLQKLEGGLSHAFGGLCVSDFGG